MAYNGIDRSDAFFAHHGIKGQKWGIRRYQNLDGTLTEEGKKKYLKVKERWSDKGVAKRDTIKKISAPAGVLTAAGSAAAGVATANPALVGLGALAGLSILKGYTIKDAIQAKKDNKIAILSKDESLRKTIEDIRTDKTGIRIKEAKVAAKIEKKLDNEQKRQLKIYEKYKTVLDKEQTPLRDEFQELIKKRGEDRSEKDEKRLIEITKKLDNMDKYMSKKYPSLSKVYNSLSKDYDLDALDDAGEFVKKELSHSGIKGQKWGLRRFQYNDGSLTPEGRKRYLKGGDRAVRKAEKQRAKREAILSDRKKLYKHRSEFTKEEIDKAMARFSSQDALRMQMNAEKEAKRRDRAELKRSKIEYKKLKLQQKQMSEQEKQAKLSTEQKKLETEQKKESADVQAASTRWRERVNKAKSIVEFAKVGKDILDDMGITSKEEGESLLGSLATAIGIKDVSAKKAASELKKQREKAQADWEFETKKMAYEKAKEEFNDRAAKKQRQEAMDELKRRQEEAKTKTAEYNANNPGKGGKGGGLTADDIEDILKKYGII